MIFTNGPWVRRFSTGTARVSQGWSIVFEPVGILEITSVAYEKMETMAKGLSQSTILVLKLQRLPRFEPTCAMICF